MDWRGYSGSREVNLMVSAAILIRDGVARQTAVTGMVVRIDSEVTRGTESSGPGDCLEEGRTGVCMMPSPLEGARIIRLRDK